MHTNLYLAEKLPTARQRELLAEADRRRLLAALASDRNPGCAAPRGSSGHSSAR